MKNSDIKILIADDDDSLRRVLEFQLQEAGFQVVAASNGAEALEMFSGEDFDCVITDWRMPQLSGLEFIQRAGAIRSETPIIVITAFGDVETAVAAMRSGAFDFISKPFDRQAIMMTVERALKYGAILSENRRLRRLVHEDFRLENVVGTSEKMRKVLETVERVSKTDVTVLIEGESGTGKELIAKGIHFSGLRRNKPFIAVNCAAIPENLIESELFGYKYGAFTGARHEGRRGKILQANGGTLFLDEIGDMPLPLQTRLLRVLEDREVTPLGGDTAVPVDLYLISATHRNLRERVESGAFREDLYYRLNGLELKLPALRERDDRSLLICDLLAEESEGASVSITEEAFEALDGYAWPGNIRQLRNVLRTAVALCEDQVVRIEDLPAEIAGPMPHGAARDAVGGFVQAEREALLGELDRQSWNITNTAARLGVSRNTLYRKMRKHGIQPREYPVP